MIFNLPCMSTNKTAKCIIKTLSKTQLNETSHCIASEEKKRRKLSFISKYKKTKEKWTQSKIEGTFASFFLLQTFCLIKELTLKEGHIHEIYKHWLIFLKRNKIQRVIRSHFIDFSKWTKVEGYIDLKVTVPLLFKDSLKSQVFSYRNFAGPSTIFKFLHSEKTWGLVHLLSFSEGYTFWKYCTRTEYQVSMKTKFRYVV